MSLLASLTFLLAISVVHPFSSCDRAKWNHARNLFNSLSNDVINYDHDIQQTCKHFKQFSAKEVFVENAYRLEIPCSGFDNAYWDLRVIHRVIYINGHFGRQGNICDLTYVDIKVLPRFIDTHNGAWKYENGMLVVAFPYKYPMDSHLVSCSQDIDRTLVYVRHGNPNEDIFDDMVN